MLQPGSGKVLRRHLRSICSAIPAHDRRRGNIFLLVAGLVGALAVCASGCSSGSHSSKGAAATATTAAGLPAAGGNSVIARGDSSPVAPDEIPACFVEGEPAAATGTERTEVYQPVPRPVTGSTAAAPTPRPTPQVAVIAAQAPAPLYAINAPVTEFAPALLRVTSVTSGNARQISLFALQYRVPAQRGGGAVVVLSAPSHAAMPPRDDLDDALDALRLEARLPGTPRPGDPLADPGGALKALGCPSHEVVNVQVDGASHAADFVSWPGAPRTQLLRLETGSTEVTIEAGLLSRESLLALTQRLAALQRSPQLVAVLQTVFGTGLPSSGGVLKTTPTPHRAATPAH